MAVVTETRPRTTIRLPAQLGIVPTASMITGAALALVWFWIPLGLMVIAVSSIPSVIGTLLAGVAFVYVIRWVDRVERARSEAVFGLGIPAGLRPRTDRDGFAGWAHQLWLDLSSAWFWKAFAHHYLRMGYDMLAVGVAFALTTFAFLAPAAAIAVSGSDPAVGLWFLPIWLAWLLALVALVLAVAILVYAPALDIRIDRRLLAPSDTEELQHRVHALSAARAGAVSSAETERYRIERDLHDSVQPRLVALAMTIGLAQTKLDTDPPAAKVLIAEAHEDAKLALAELRDVVRGIAPTILADRGLDAALSAVAQRAQSSGVPTHLDVDLPRRLPAETEAVAYFVVAEALTNVVRHAKATRAVMTLRLDELAHRLHVSIYDDGRGGAGAREDPDSTGLRGLAERVRAAGGEFTVSSPATGPTIVTAVLPCES